MSFDILWNSCNIPNPLAQFCEWKLLKYYFFSQPIFNSAIKSIYRLYRSLLNFLTGIVFVSFHSLFFVQQYFIICYKLQAAVPASKVGPKGDGAAATKIRNVVFSRKFSAFLSRSHLFSFLFIAFLWWNIYVPSKFSLCFDSGAR